MNALYAIALIRERGRPGDLDAFRAIFINIVTVRVGACLDVFDGTDHPASHEVWLWPIARIGHWLVSFSRGIFEDGRRELPRPFLADSHMSVASSILVGLDAPTGR